MGHSHFNCEGIKTQWNCKAKEVFGYLEINPQILLNFLCIATSPTLKVSLIQQKASAAQISLATESE